MGTNIDVQVRQRFEQFLEQISSVPTGRNLVKSFREKPLFFSTDEGFLSEEREQIEQGGTRVFIVYPHSPIGKDMTRANKFARVSEIKKGQLLFLNSDLLLKSQVRDVVGFLSEELQHMVSGIDLSGDISPDERRLRLIGSEAAGLYTRVKILDEMGRERKVDLSPK